MYGLLTPIRYVLNPRFGLTTPIQAGLFYIAPGIGYLVGTFFGGRYADRVVKKYITKRDRRVPEDRLRSCLPFLGVAIPGCMIIYGWSIEKRVGGVPLPCIMMFLQGVAQLFCFPALNAYCLDVMQDKSAEVIGKFPPIYVKFSRTHIGIQLVTTSSVICSQPPGPQRVYQLFRQSGLDGSRPSRQPF